MINVKDIPNFPPIETFDSSMIPNVPEEKEPVAYNNVPQEEWDNVNINIHEL